LQSGLPHRSRGYSIQRLAPMAWHTTRKQFSSKQKHISNPEGWARARDSANIAAALAACAQPKTCGKSTKHAFMTPFLLFRFCSLHGGRGRRFGARVACRCLRVASRRPGVSRVPRRVVDRRRVHLNGGCSVARRWDADYPTRARDVTQVVSDRFPHESAAEAKEQQSCSDTG
jgi:hypothetical protein